MAADAYRVHEAALEALLKGQAGRAREVLGGCPAPVPWPCRSLAAAALTLAGDAGRWTAWRELLDGLNGPGARTALATLAGEAGFAAGPFLAAATGEGAPPPPGPAGLRLVGLGRDGMKWRLPLPAAEPLLVHVLAWCPSYTGDRFYIHARGAAAGESVRLAAGRVVFARSGLALATPTRVPRLLSFLLAGGGCLSCLDGEAVALTREGGAAAPGLELEIAPDPEGRSDVEGSILAVEIVHAPAAALPDPATTAFQQARVRRCLEREEADALLEALAVLAARDGAEAAPAVRETLDGLGRAGRSPDWLLAGVLALLPEAEARAWAAANPGAWRPRLVEAREVTVRFFRQAQKLFTWPRLRRRLLGRGEDDSFLVLKEISLDLHEGDILGIIGRNGAGKSTLLRAIAGMIPLERGRILLLGRHLLLSAGLGMRLELTGRENIYLGGYFMGLDHAEVGRLLDEVIDFAELRYAIDQPFKFYSDGMKARLVFSLATSVSPEILMLDELLSAGDLSFQAKAEKRMEEMIARAGAVVVVTHGVDFVRKRCNKALYLRDGSCVCYGSPQRAVDLYLRDLHLGEAEGRSDPAALAATLAMAGSPGMAAGGR